MDHTKTILITNGWESLDSKAFVLKLISAHHPSHASHEQGSVNTSEKSEHKFSKRLIRLGTHVDNDLCLTDPSVSRFHAYIEVDQHGHKIVDQNSKNGVFINGIRVKEAYLQNHVHIHLGSIQLVYQQLESEKVQHILSKRTSFGELIGQSAPMREVFALLERCAPSEMTILIEGASGTGKELAAHALHQHSPRAQRPFIVFDCSAVPSNLIESELFGHKKGSFTGASQDRVGAFSRAEGGTLFLDEIGELPLALQSRLLRALEKQEIKSVGADHYTKVNVRVVAATNRQLNQEVEQGNFRLDLYYRLAVLKVRLPSLKHHKEDIPFLVKHFIHQLSQGQPREVSYETMLKLQEYDWPGNVRELKNFVSRAVAMTLPSDPQLNEHYLLPTEIRPLPQSMDIHVRDEQTINAHHSHSHESHSDELNHTQSDATSMVDHHVIHQDMMNHHRPFTQLTWEQKTTYLSPWIQSEHAFKTAKAQLISDFEVMYWSRLLTHTNDNVSAAARIAGIHRKSAEYLIKKLNLKNSESKEKNHVE